MAHTEISMYGLIVQSPAVTCKLHWGVTKLRPAANFRVTAVYQLHPGLLRVRVLVASLSKFSVITAASHADEVKMEPVKVNKVIRS
jgi:hypothetical protein